MKFSTTSNFAIQVMILCWYEQKVSNPRRCSNLICVSLKKQLLWYFIREKRLRSIYDILSLLLLTFAFLQKRILCLLSYRNMPILMSMLRDFPYFLQTLATFIFKISFFFNHTLNCSWWFVKDGVTKDTSVTPSLT